MKINISFTSLKHYDRTNIHWWFWTFRRYISVKGFILRICGIYLNVREKNATVKLIELARRNNA